MEYDTKTRKTDHGGTSNYLAARANNRDFSAVHDQRQDVVCFHLCPRPMAGYNCQFPNGVLNSVMTTDYNTRHKPLTMCTELLLKPTTSRNKQMARRLLRSLGS